MTRTRLRWAVTGTWKGIVYTKSEFEPDYVTLAIREDGS
jgi:hypothetical protein